MPAITVRPLTPDDASAYRALRLAGIAELPAAFCTTHAAESGLPLARIAERLRATSYQIIFGAFDKEQLIGIAGLRREPIAVVHDKASLWSVYVAPQARGRGAGRQLVQAAIAHACAIARTGPRAPGRGAGQPRGVDPVPQLAVLRWRTVPHRMACCKCNCCCPALPVQVPKVMSL